MVGWDEHMFRYLFFSQVYAEGSADYNMYYRYSIYAVDKFTTHVLFHTI